MTARFARNLITRTVPAGMGTLPLSISVYNAAGNFQKNEQDAYSLNSITAKRGDDGSVTVQFGGCDTPMAANCLPIMPGWNYMVRMYRPHAEILSGAWTFPEARPTQ